MNSYIYTLSIFLIFLVFLRYLNNGIIKKKATFNIKGYKTFYQDSKSNNDEIIESRLLYSKKYKLKGKPDYILKHITKEEYIPIELKSGKIGEANLPHRGDFLQIITYFLIIEEEFLFKPKYGKIIYSDYMFIVKNKAKYKKDLLFTTSQMKEILKSGKIKCDKPTFVKCKNCLCNNTVCEVNK